MKMTKAVTKGFAMHLAALMMQAFQFEAAEIFHGVLDAITHSQIRQ